MTQKTNPLTGQPIETDNPNGHSGSGWRLVIVLIIGFALGFGAAWLWVNRPAQIDETADDTIEDDTTIVDDVAVDDTEAEEDDTNLGDVTATGSSEEEVLVKDQEAGESVFITRITLMQDGWVAVQEVLPNGQLANILGAKRFDAGTSQGTVGLLRGTTAESTYAVTLWYDNGDGAFDHTTDALVTDNRGAAVSMEFEAY